MGNILFYIMILIVQFFVINNRFSSAADNDTDLGSIYCDISFNYGKLIKGQKIFSMSDKEITYFSNGFKIMLPRDQITSLKCEQNIINKTVTKRIVVRIEGNDSTFDFSGNKIKNAGKNTIQK